jgi:ribosomal protein S18 acetylase RimI-like enzyme
VGDAGGEMARYTHADEIWGEDTGRERGDGKGGKKSGARIQIGLQSSNEFVRNVNTVEEASIIRDIEQPDVQVAGEVLANAFRGYPFFEYCLDEADNYERMAPGMFASFVRWTMLYGKAWATSDLNAVALRQPPGTRSIGFWNALRSGLAFSFLRMDGATRRRFSRTTPIIAETHKRIMGDQPHWHCWMMGVAPACQGRGVGRQLMRHTFEQSDRAGLPCYLETFSGSSVRVHESQLYSIRKAIAIPGTSLTLYAMVRPPQ